MLLAIDATQSPINIAVGSDGVVYGHAVGPVQRNAADNLFEIIGEAIKQSGKNKDCITGIVALTGPGSFTGIRVGLSFAQSFALAKAIPVYCLTAFDVLSFSAAAWGSKKNSLDTCTWGENDKKLIIVESKRTELYAQFYQDNLPFGQPLMANLAELTVLTVQENAAIFAPKIYCPNFINLSNSNFYDPTHLSRLALQAYWQLKPTAQQILTPFYIRPPDAVPQIKVINT